MPVRRLLWSDLIISNWVTASAREYLLLDKAPGCSYSPRYASFYRLATISKFLEDCNIFVYEIAEAQKMRSLFSIGIDQRFCPSFESVNDVFERH